jgi:hypothetical protein
MTKRILKLLFIGLLFHNITLANPVNDAQAAKVALSFWNLHTSTPKTVFDIANGYSNFATITVENPDSYEPNNTVSQAYNLPVSFSGSTATVQTTGSNLHNSTDIDYYKIVLPAGYNYMISGRLHDSYNSSADTFTVDAKVAYSINAGSSWSSNYDTHILEGSAFSIIGGSTVYFRVQSYSSGNTGTYLLDLNIVRSAYDIRQYSNVTASPTTISPGNPFSVSVNILNDGNNTFSGLFAAVVFDELTEEIVDVVEFIAVSSLLPNYYASCTFTTSGIADMIPGRYFVQLFYQPEEEANDWFPVVANGYTNFATITVAIPTLFQNSNITVAPSSITQGAPFSVSASILNYSTVNFSGALKASVYNTEGTLPIADIETITTSLPVNHSNTFTFNTSGIANMPPGNYVIKLLYRPTAGSEWEEVIRTGTSYGYITVVSADPYEVNNTVDQAYNLPVSSSSNTVMVETTGSNFHNSTDIDYYKIVLPANGYDYTISGRLYDSYSGSSFTVNAKVAYSTNVGSSWSSDYDTYIAGTVSVSGGDSVYFRVQPYASGAIGTYLLSLDITRKSLGPDPYEFNNTGGEAYTLPVSFSNRTAIVQTYKSNIHDASDIDYYKIVLPKGDNYIVSGQLHDANNSIFTLDAKVAYSDDNGNAWSSYQDTYIVNNGGSLTVIDGGTLLFRARANNDGEIGTYLLEINILRTTGITESTKDNSFTVYPNPAKDHVVFDFSKLEIPVTHITVLNAQGKNLKDTDVNNPSQITMPVGDWAIGLYFIQCQTAEGIITRKFMVR